MSHHLVKALIEAYGAVPICPEDHFTTNIITAPVQGRKDPTMFGHEWSERGTPYWCVHQVFPAEEGTDSESGSGAD